MITQNRHNLSGRILLTLATGMLALVTQSARAVGLTYVDADAFNLAPIGAITGPSNGGDNLWFQRAGFGSGSTLFESNNAIEDSPELTQTVFVAPGAYDVYAVFWTDDDENWGIRAGLSSGNLTATSFTGSGGTYPITGASTGVFGGIAVWDFLPAPTDEGTIFTERPADPIPMLLAYAGTKVVDGSGQLDVFVDDLADTTWGGLRRAWFDGIAYAPAGTPIALEVSIDRTTGVLTFNNPTSGDFRFKSISIESATGELKSSTWTPITGSVDGGGGPGNGSFDTDAWTVVTPAIPGAVEYETLLAEQEAVGGDGQGGLLAAGTGSLNLGSLWHRSPFEDVIVRLVFADDTIATIVPNYTGDAVPLGSFDLDADIDSNDYAILLANMHTSVLGELRSEAHTSGEMTGDGLINGLDLLAFRLAYDDFNGFGAFEAMASAQVPEPGAFGLMLAFAAIFCVRSARKLKVAAWCAVAICITCAETSRAVPFLAVDINDRTSTDSPDTQTGFEPFLITGTTNSSVQAVGAYTVTLSPYDDMLDENSVTDGVQNTTGAIDDRDRADPVDINAFTLAQLYDDFVFAGTSTGPTGGMNLAISGGTLSPNTPYYVSIYSWDRSSTGPRMADWYDLNQPLAPILRTEFSGATANLPIDNNRYRFTGVVQSDETGALLLGGRSASGYSATGPATNAVFLNGFELEEYTGLTLEVDTSTGIMTLVNEQASSQDMNYYEILSGSGQLIDGNWNSLDAGDGTGVGWDEVSNSAATVLSEINFSSSTTLEASGNVGDSIELGAVFTLNGMQDIRFNYTAPGDTVLRPGYVKYVSTVVPLSGDYNNDGIVNAADYAVWRDNLGSNAVLNGDTTPGDVSPADYNVWKANFGATPLGAGSGAGTTIPEPSTASLIGMTLVILGIGYRFRL